MGTLSPSACWNLPSPTGSMRVNNIQIRPHCILDKNNSAFVVVLVLNLFELVMSSLLCGNSFKKIVYIYIYMIFLRCE